MKRYRIFLLLFSFLCVFFSCKKDEKLSQPAPLPYYVSGDYLCRDSTYNSIYGYYPNPGTIQSYDSSYILHISYSDTLNNNIIIIGNPSLFSSNTYHLDSRNIYTIYAHSGGGDTIDSLNISDNAFFFRRWARSGGSHYFTRITGTKIK